MNQAKLDRLSRQRARRAIEQHAGRKMVIELIILRGVNPARGGWSITMPPTCEVPTAEVVKVLRAIAHRLEAGLIEVIEDEPSPDGSRHS